jgi:hypothetical protein
MVKRAKLTLNHPETKENAEQTSEAAVAEPTGTDQSTVSNRKNNLGKLIILAGITIASLIIFRQKIL